MVTTPSVCSSVAAVAAVDVSVVPVDGDVAEPPSPLELSEPPVLPEPLWPPNGEVGRKSLVSGCV